MYASRTICSRCASYAFTTQARKSGGVALIATLSDAAASSNPTPTRQGHGHEAETSGRQWSGPSRISRRKNFTQRPSFSQRDSNKSSEDSAIALFNDVVKGGPRDKPELANQPFLGELEITAKLKELSESSIGVAERLQSFQVEIWPHLKEFRGRIPKHLLISTTQFLDKTCNNMAAGGCTRDSVKLAQIYRSIGKYDLDIRNQIVLNICHGIVQSETGDNSPKVLVNELIGMWKHISQLRRKSQERQGLQFTLSSVDEVLNDINQGQQKGRLDLTTRALVAPFPQFSPEQAREIIPGLLVSAAVLSDKNLVRVPMQFAAAPLLNMMAVILGKVVVDEAYIFRVFSGRIRFPPAKLSELKGYLERQWHTTTEVLSQSDAVWRRGLRAEERSEPSGLAAYRKQFQAAYSSSTRNAGAAISIWEDLKAHLERQPDFQEQIRNDSEFLDFCIFIWCAVRRPAQLQETLDMMKQLGVHPTVKSYTSMMHGWKMCKDTGRIEALWEKLASSGMKLDVVVWTERISALIEGSNPQSGIQALAEMQARWKQAVEKNAPHMAVQPSIEVVNAAFKGLLGIDRRAAFDVLEWASRENIEPNIRTYNILLRDSFQGDTTEDMQSLLNTMTKHGIEPDSATFTIILEEVLGAIGNDSAADQVQAIEQVLGDIKSAGLKPNLETYGKMLYAVSSLANGADEAINAVQMHMRENGLKMTPHMVTILIERALNRDPPDINSINKLLRKHGILNVTQGDQTLWERVMSAHAIAGDTTRAMAIFNELAAGGRPVTSLACLTDLLRALLAGEQLEEAKGVVSVVLQYKKQDGKRTGDVRYWNHHFWYLAKENQLLNREEVPRELEIQFHI